MPDPRDRQLLKAIIFGVLRNLGYIDWTLTQLSKHPLQKIKPITLQALRTGAYQILFMDRIPDSAAINETIKALKVAKQPRWLTGYVNGILRNITRQRIDLLAKKKAGHLPPSALFNHPTWLLERWQKRYGPQGMQAICQSNSLPAKICLRVNTTKTTIENFTKLLAENDYNFTYGKYLPDAIWLENSGAIEAIPGYQQGFFLVQDEMAQLICHLLNPFPEGSYLDGCAGLGGKTAVLAQMIPNKNSLYAVEPQSRRQKLLQENLTRLGFEQVSCFAGELEGFAAQSNVSYSHILLDVPCSGLGVTGRHPDIRWNRKPEDLLRFASTQTNLLKTAAAMLAPEGILIYATCSTEPEENDEVITLFLKNNPHFSIENAKDILPPEAACFIDDQGFLRTVPGSQTTDGFFGARLRKNTLPVR